MLHVIEYGRRSFDDKPRSVVSEIGVAVVTIELWHPDAVVLKTKVGESVEQTKYGTKTHFVPMKTPDNAFLKEICSWKYATFKIQECLSPNSTNSMRCSQERPCLASTNLFFQRSQSFGICGGRRLLEQARCCAQISFKCRHNFPPTRNCMHGTIGSSSQFFSQMSKIE